MTLDKPLLSETPDDTRPRGALAPLGRLFVSTLFVLPLAARADDWNATLAVTSQLVDRGIPQSPPGTVVQGAATWASPSGWSAGLSASYQGRTPRHLAEALAQVAKAWRIDDDWQIQASVLDYRYPNNARWRPYERVELGVGAIYRDVLTVNVSGGWRSHGGGGPRGAADIGLRWPLTDHLALSTGVGVAQYIVTPYRAYEGRRIYADSGRYTYGQAGLSWTDAHWRVELVRIGANRTRLPGERDVSPWLATVARSF